jgi:hypothetical protein
MKRTLIVTLVCVNVALLLALLLGTFTPNANAQVYRGAADYLMTIGRIGSDRDAVYVIDLDTRRMLAWQYDQTRQRLVPFQGRRLKTDFRRPPEPE